MALSSCCFPHKNGYSLLGTCDSKRILKAFHLLHWRNRLGSAPHTLFISTPLHSRLFVCFHRVPIGTGWAPYSSSTCEIRFSVCGLKYPAKRRTPLHIRRKRWWRRSRLQMVGVPARVPGTCSFCFVTQNLPEGTLSDSLRLAQLPFEPV